MGQAQFPPPEPAHEIVLTATAGLLLFGFGWTLLFEWSNPATLGAFDTPHKLLAAAFESVTLRTAGFNTIDLGALTGPSQAVSCLSCSSADRPAQQQAASRP